MALSNCSALYAFDKNIEVTRSVRVVGLDEAGRGPLAGPVVAAAVILDLDKPIDGINDSKKLSAKKRDALYISITKEAVCWAVAQASPEEIDSLNILRASLLAMKRALDKIEQAWSLAIIDGNVRIPEVAPDRQETIVKGDGKSASIAAASILAKVTRDRIMEQYEMQFPLYQFATHKGYPTALHRELVQKNGMCQIHRKSFCRSLKTQTTLEL